MYEIWLVMNIVWEIILGIWPLLVLGVAAWLLLLALAWRRPGTHWRGALPMATGLAAVAALVGFLAVPFATRSSLHELAYWVDWANLAGIALGIGVTVLAFAWPAGVLQRPRSVARDFSK
jgi:hypothetical protein